MCSWVWLKFDPWWLNIELSNEMTNESQIRLWTYKRQPITRPHRWAMGCLLWIFLRNLLCYNCTVLYVDGLVPDCCNSIANTMELMQSCVKPSMSSFPEPIHQGPVSLRLMTSQFKYIVNPTKTEVNWMHILLFGFQILSEISKVPFEISHKILSSYAAKYAFYKVLKLCQVMIF